MVRRLMVYEGNVGLKILDPGSQLKRTDEEISGWSKGWDQDIKKISNIVNKRAESDTLTDDLNFLPTRTIKDPEAKKPPDWFDNAKMDDPKDFKPGTIVDNLMITDDAATAKKAKEELCAVTKEAEGKMKNAPDEEKRPKAEAEAKKDEAEKDRVDEEEGTSENIKETEDGLANPTDENIIEEVSENEAKDIDRSKNKKVEDGSKFEEEIEAIVLESDAKFTNHASLWWGV